MENEIKIIITAEDLATPVIESINKQLESIGKIKLPQIDATPINQASKAMENLSSSTYQIPANMELVSRSIKNTGKGAAQIVEKFKAIKIDPTKLLTPLDIMQKQLDSMSFETVGTFDDYLQNAGITAKQFREEMGDMFVDIGGGELFNKLTGETIKYQKAVAIATTKTRRFKFEYLSLLFAGMALDRAFSGLLRTQLELFGVTEMMSSTWTVVLLPVMEVLTPILYKLMEVFMNLPDPVKAAVGAFVLVGAALGKIMASIGQVMLFMMGLKLIWPGAYKAILAATKTFGSTLVKLFTQPLTLIRTAFTSLWGAIIAGIQGVATFLGVSFGAAVAIVAGIILAITAIIFGAIAAWKNNFLGFKDAIIGIWTSIKTFIMGFFDFLKGAWDILIGIFTLNGDKIKQGFSKIVEGIKNMFKGLGNFLISIFNGLVSLVIASLAQIIRAIQYIWNKIPGHKDVTWYEDIMNWGKNVKLIPSFKTGGIMPETGLALIHAGEEIIPRNQVNSNSSTFAPVVNVYAGGGNVNANDIARQVSETLNKEWSYKFQRMNRR
jgi:hypothetical protein